MGSRRPAVPALRRPRHQKHPHRPDRRLRADGANPVKRDPTLAKKARKDLYISLRDRIQEDLSKTMGQREARKLSEMQSKETMSTLAALHNPDLSAGGRDAIADFGDRQVNSSIGPQWKSRIGGLRQAAEEMAEMGGKAGLLNVKLHKC
ncbi:hypothetical protein C2H86_17855 [Pseudomonas putida]|uniref:Novel toxin 15 domain-containing protein n=1 Tax=Pseudomonas putida TaxID=303 RepID=A0A6I6Y129_PSEPU|nr:hypothetical protein C2H86_17855 [Pseudomonas putida]